MFKPVAMLKLNVLVLEKHVTPITEELGRLGLLHLIDAVSQSKGRLLEDVDKGRDIQELDRLVARCRDVLQALDLTPEQVPPVVPPEQLSAMTGLVTQVEKQLREEDEAVNQLIGQTAALRKEASTLGRYPFQQTRLDALRDLSHLYIATGRIPPTAFPGLAEKLKDRGVVLSESSTGQSSRDGTDVLLISSRKERFAVQSELDKAGFKKAELPTEHDGTIQEEQQLLTAEDERIRLEIMKHHAAIEALRSENGPMIVSIYRHVRNALAVSQAQEHFGKTADLYCISGWIPHRLQEEVETLVDRVTNGTGLVEVIPPWDDARVQAGLENVPVQFPENRMLRPFQQLVATFGAPKYQEVEPSMFVALSFVLMFGIMFGDVGQGIIIAALGAWLTKTKHPQLSAFSDSGYMLLLCGGSATLFGALYGSIFGYEEMLPHVWLSPLHDIMKLFSTTVCIGIVFISVGILINIVNRLRSKQYFEGIFDKFGIIGILFYWGSLGLGVKALVTGERLGTWEIVFVLVLPLGILFVREPLFNLLTHKKKLLHEDLFSYVLESSIEIMETLTTFLGSTVSFIRVGAFALSHAALCLAIYSLVEILHELPGGGLWATLVIIFGNLMVIVLEGMVVMIQGVRLQYYELFSKYFTGDGVLYAPFQISRVEMESGNRKEKSEA